MFVSLEFCLSFVVATQAFRSIWTTTSLGKHSVSKLDHFLTTFKLGI